MFKDSHEKLLRVCIGLQLTVIEHADETLPRSRILGTMRDLSNQIRSLIAELAREH